MQRCDAVRADARAIGRTAAVAVMTVLVGCYCFALTSTAAQANTAAPASPANAAPPQINLPEQPAGYAAQKNRALSGPNVPATSVGAAAAPRAAQPSVSLSNSFGGTVRSQAGNWDPPDTNVAAGSNTELEAVNEALRITTQSGAQLAFATLGSFWTVGLASPGNTYDTKVFHDNNSIRPRYYVVSLQYAGRNTPNNTADDAARVMFAVSRSSDPTGLGSTDWCQYFYNGVRSSNAGNTWADYPAIGFGADAFTISTNQFTFPNPTEAFQFSTLAWLQKNLVNNNANACPTGGSLGFGEQNVSQFTLQPSQQYTSASSFTNVTNPVYFVSSAVNGGSSYIVWRLANVATTPSFVQLATVTAPAYSLPPNPPGGASGTIDAGDARVLQVASRGDVLRAVHTTGCQFTNNTSIEDCFRYVKISVTASGASLTESQTIGGGDNNYYNFPSIAVDSSNRIAIAVQTELSQSSWFLGGAVITRKEGGVFDLLQLDTGTCAIAGATEESSGAQRSGDFTGAQTTADGSHFWVAIEGAHSLSGTCGWSTRVANPK